MAGTIIPWPVFTGFDNNGDPLNGGKLFTYASGTVTDQATYSDSALTVANTNPVILDAAGRATIFLLPSSYKFVLKTSADVTLWTIDGVSASAAFDSNLDILNQTAGETLTAGQGVYLSDGSGALTAGRWYRWDADQTYSSTTAGAIGMVPSTIASGATGAIRLQGRVTGLTGLVAGTSYYVSATAGALTSSAPTNTRFVGVADTTTSLILNANQIATTLNTLTITGSMAIGTTPQAGMSLVIASSNLTGTTQRGVYAAPIGSSAATAAVTSLETLASTAAAAFTATNVHGLLVETNAAGAGSTITNNYGIRVANQTAGTRNFAIKTGTGAHHFGAPIVKTLTTTANSTDSNQTYTAAQVLGGVITRSGLSANRTDAMPTAANLVAGIPNAAVGMSFDFVLANLDAGFTVILSGASAGITYTASVNVPAGTNAFVRTVLTNVGSGTEAATVYLSV